MMCSFIMDARVFLESHIVTKGSATHIPASAVFCGVRQERHQMIYVLLTTMSLETKVETVDMTGKTNLIENADQKILAAECCIANIKMRN